MSLTPPRLTSSLPLKLRIISATGWTCPDLSSVGIMLSHKPNLLILARSGYGDRYAYAPSRAHQAGPRLSGDGTGALSSLQGDVRICYPGLARRRRLSRAEYCCPRSTRGTAIWQGRRLVRSFWDDGQPTGHTHAPQAAAVFHPL
jgi:hypothetical protein